MPTYRRSLAVISLVAAFYFAFAVPVRAQRRIELRALAVTSDSASFTDRTVLVGGGLVVALRDGIDVFVDVSQEVGHAYPPEPAGSRVPAVPVQVVITNEPLGTRRDNRLFAAGARIGPQDQKWRPFLELGFGATRQREVYSGRTTSHADGMGIVGDGLAFPVSGPLVMELGYRCGIVSAGSEYFSLQIVHAGFRVKLRN